MVNVVDEEKKPENKNKIKRFSLSKEERDKIQNLQSVMGILTMLRDGMNHSIILEIAKIRNRLGVKESDAPKGYQRIVDFDAEKYELLVMDMFIEKKPEDSKEKEVEAKN